MSEVTEPLHDAAKAGPALSFASRVRYYHPWNGREQAYHAILRSTSLHNVLPWNDWSFALASLVRSLFPFSLIRPGDTVVQVGANRNSLVVPGSSQPMLLAACVGNTGRLICIDSEKDNVATLQRAIELLNLNFIEPLQYAVSDRAGSISGIDVKGHSYFWDPQLEQQRASSNSERGELKDLWKEIRETGTTVSSQGERLDAILASVRAKPSFVNLTINGYEPTAIRGMGDLLKEDVVISFVARMPEAFWDNGFLDELENMGFVLVLSNLPHSHHAHEAWFPYITAMRPHQLARCGALAKGRFDIDPSSKVLAFFDDQGNRLY